MIRHLLRLAWNRKRAYLLLGLEIQICFLILAVIGISGTHHWRDFHRPLGFEYQGVWAVMMNRDNPSGWKAPTPADSAAMQQVYRVLLGSEEVEVLAEDNCSPFMSECSNVAEVEGRSVDYYTSFVGDDLADLLHLDLEAGRWFEQADDALAEEPVVLNGRFARLLFGEQDPVGLTRLLRVGLKAEQELQIRVVGVVSEYRPFLSMDEPGYFLFRRARLDRPISAHYSGDLPSSFLLRVRPDTPRSLEQRLDEQLRAAAPGWNAAIVPLEEGRAENIRSRLRPLVIAGIVGGFLLLMVALGLVGVLWQSATRRTREIGIRRAAGATRGRICLQFVGEILVLTSIAVVVGAVLVAHSSALALFPAVSGGVYLAGFLAAAGGLYLLVVAAALYPGWLAARVRPAQALHCE
jgi:putative ABC transport system permease protein